ncbi:aspartate racemase [Candidatus Marinamargulisbacteria bacterium SCGC AG-410-N11]|nr:aspartate racemase [Candidatus Marinamargulisbacteria bacterium SCGC AG-410-N11]
MIKTIGIMGGMGPLATNYFYSKIIEFTPAVKDQEHIPTIIISDPTVPDRTACIQSGDYHLVEAKLLRMAQLLESSNVEVLVMPCNTAHFFWNRIKSQVNLPFIDMIDATLEQVSGQDRIGLLATTGTIQSQLYQHYAKKYNIDIVVPSDSLQVVVMQAIMKIKSGVPGKQVFELLGSVMSDFESNHVNTIIMGCTEVPLIFQDNLNDSLLDPMDILAKRVVQFALSDTEK